jgi:hypothetical protein
MDLRRILAIDCSKLGSIDGSLVDLKDGAQIGLVGSDRLELDLLNSTSTVLSCDQLIIRKIQMM